MHAYAREQFLLDPEVRFLNHGSFGSTPRVVLDFQRALHEEMEHEPIVFLLRKLEQRLDEVREKLGAFVGAHAEDLAFLSNATMAVNAVFRSLRFEAGDELLTTDHAYNACANVLHFVADRAGAKVVVANIPFPIASPDVVAERVMERVTSRTKLVLLDHITSPTGIIFPVEQIVRELDARGIDCMIDGAHAPGMIPLDIDAIGAAYYTGNCHKWVCAPKGAAFLRVRKDRQHLIRPTSISHGANSTRSDRSRYLQEFDWPGTQDYTAILTIPKAIEFLGSLLPGGWDELRRSNRAKALAAREILCRALGIDKPSPDSMIGTLAAVPLPDPKDAAPWDVLNISPLQNELFEQHRIEVPVFPWPKVPHRLLRVSAQIYNDIGEYEALGEALKNV